MLQKLGNLLCDFYVRNISFAQCCLRLRFFSECFLQNCYCSTDLIRSTIKFLIAKKERLLKLVNKKEKSDFKWSHKEKNPENSLIYILLLSLNC